jgi:glycosyltransferase involved in cell wall biosynthesis
MKLSCIIHTRNSAETLDKALDSVAWADEIIVVDMESTDSTRAIAAKYTQRILSTPIVPRVDGIRQQFLAEARHDWIFVLDSDEHLAADAKAHVTNILDNTVIGTTLLSFRGPITLPARSCGAAAGTRRLRSASFGKGQSAGRTQTINCPK